MKAGRVKVKVFGSRLRVGVEVSGLWENRVCGKRRVVGKELEKT